MLRPILLCSTVLLCLHAVPAHADGSRRVLSRDATFFRSVVRTDAATEFRRALMAASAERGKPGAGRSDESKAERDDRRIAGYVGGAAVVGLAAYFIASSGDGHDIIGPNRDDEGGVTLPAENPFAPPDDEIPPGGGPGQGGPAGDDELEPQIVPDPTTVTPEPVSMTLVATGLTGMSLATYRRRRRSGR